MNTIGIALVWCIVQVTLLGVLSAALYLIARRIRPGAGAPIALTGLLAVVVLSALALSPWPRWTWDVAATSSAVADGNVAQPPSAVASGDVARPPSAVDASNNPLSPTADPSSQSRAAGGRDSVVATAAALWQGFLYELSREQPPSGRTTWAWPAVIAVVVLTGMAGGLVWLVLGLLAVRWHRARSRPVEDAGLSALVEQLRTELGCRRRVELRESDDLVTAATIGWRHPGILLPRDWPSWTEDQRRAVLAHEMAHVRRNDFLAVLCGQLGVVLHFYHPLLHWLMGRLRLEQELAADAAAAGVSGGQRKYLVTIAELALRQQDRRLAWPARTFLPTRTTFLRRITMLRDSRLRFDRLSPVLKVVIVAAVAACGVLVAGLRGPGMSAPALADDPGQPASTSAVYTGEPSAAEAAAVAKIRELGGDAWTDEKNPGGPVVGVQFSHTKAGDAALVHLEGLTKLEELLLRNTSVTDAGMEHLKGLAQLRRLDVGDTQVTDSGLKHLKGLTNLQTLVLWNTKVTDAGLKHLNGLTQLQTLWLAGTKVSGAGLEHLKGLTKLRDLDLDHTQVTDAGLQHLQGLTELRDLHLASTQVTGTGLEHLKGLTNLQTLVLFGTKLSDAALEHLKGLTQLQYLNLGRTKVTDAGLEYLKRLTKLRDLSLAGTQVTDAGLQHLTRLPELFSLNLQSTQVTDVGLKQLKGLAKLMNLQLWDSKVTDAGVKDLQKALPNVRVDR